MKMINKIVAFLLSILMLTTFFAYATDVENTKSMPKEEAIGLLATLGVVDLTQSDQKYDTPISKGEFVVLVAKALGISGVASEDGEDLFVDVDFASNIYPYLSFFKGAGIISGNNFNEFLPDNMITYNEAIVILVRLLGHQMSAQSKGGYPSGYLTIAAELKLGFVSQPQITRGNALSLLYNALKIDVYSLVSFGGEMTFASKKGYTLLSQYRDIYMSTGQVTGVKATKLTGVSDLRANEIAIDNLVFQKKAEVSDNLLGYKINYFYTYTTQSTDEKVVIYAYKLLTNNKVLSIDAKDLENVYNFEINYSKNDKMISEKITNSATIIFNGKATKKLLPEFFPLIDGKVELLDIGNGYEMVFITSYKNVMVHSVDVDEMIIYTEDQSYGYIDLSESDIDYSIKDRDGADVAISKIKEMSIVTIQRSEDKKYYKIFVSESVYEGSVKSLELSDNIFDININIEGQNFKAAPDIDITKITSLELGANKHFYLDVFDRIVDVKNYDLSTIKVGYVTNASCEKKIETIVKLRIFTTDTKLIDFTLASSVNYNGEKISNKQSIYDSMCSDIEGVQTFNPVLITYEVNTDGEITKLNTPYTDSSDQGSRSVDSLRYYCAKAQGASFKTKLSTLNGLINVDTRTKVLVIPDDLTNVNNFVVANGSYFTNDTTYTVDTFTLTSDSMRPDYIVVYRSGTTLTNTTMVALVGKITDAIDSEGNITKKLHCVINGAEKEYFASEANLLDNINSGDIIRFGTSLSGMITSVPTKDFDYNTQKFVSAITNPNNTLFTAEYRFSYGGVYKKKDGTIAVTFDIPNIGTTKLSVQNKCELYQLDKFKFAVYDSNAGGGYAKVGKISDIKDYISSHDKYSKVYIHTRYGDPMTIVIYN